MRSIIYSSGAMTQDAPRNTYARVDALEFRLKAACALLGVSDVTLRHYTEKSGIAVARAKTGVAARVFYPDTLFELTHWRRTAGLVKTPQQAGKPVFITVDVVKGGTGKTTTAVETAMHLQFLGLKVLAIDLDVQANLTQCFGYEDDIELKEIEKFGLTEEAVIQLTFAKLVKPYIEYKRTKHPMPDLTGLIKKPFGAHGPHVIGADTYLGDLELDIANSTGRRELLFRAIFDLSLEGKIPGFDLNEYDVVIMDCPPNVSLTSTAALAAADLVIAPVRMDSFAIKGLRRLMGEIESVWESYQVRPDLIILPTHFSPQFARNSRMQANVNQYSDALAPQTISLSEEFPKAIENYLPLALQKPTSNAVKEYKAFAEFMYQKVLQIAADKAKKASS